MFAFVVMYTVNLFGTSFRKILKIPQERSGANEFDPFTGKYYWTVVSSMVENFLNPILVSNIGLWTMHTWNIHLRSPTFIVVCIFLRALLGGRPGSLFFWQFFRGNSFVFFSSFLHFSYKSGSGLSRGGISGSSGHRFNQIQSDQIRSDQMWIAANQPHILPPPTNLKIWNLKFKI